MKTISRAQQAVAADTLIEASIVAGFRLRSLWQLLGTLFHPRAAEPPSVRRRSNFSSA
jgi:hypothetical protein